MDGVNSNSGCHGCHIFKDVVMNRRLRQKVEKVYIFEKLSAQDFQIYQIHQYRCFRSNVIGSRV